MSALAADGHVGLVRDEDGAVFVNSRGRGVALMCGLLCGTIHDMRAAVDALLEDAECEGVHECDALVLTRYPSFRVPNAVLRYCFAYLRHHASMFAAIHFVDLDPVKRAAFRTACLALPHELRSLVRVTKSDEVRSLAGVDARLLATNEARLAALCHARPPDPVEPATFFDGHKRGSGGPGGSLRWKPKRFYSSADRLWYADPRDARLEGVREALVACHMEATGPGEALIRTPRATWHIRAHEDSLRTLSAKLARAAAACEAEEA